MRRTDNKLNSSKKAAMGEKSNEIMKIPPTPKVKLTPPGREIRTASEEKWNNNRIIFMDSPFFHLFIFHFTDVLNSLFLQTLLLYLRKKMEEKTS